MKPFRIIFTILILVCGAYACKPTVSTAQQSELNLPSRSALLRKFREERKIWILFQGESDESTQQWEEILNKTIKSLPSWFSVELIPAKEAADTLIKRHPILLVGTPRGNPYLSNLNHQLPVQIKSESVTFAGQTFEDSLTSLSLNFIPNPLNPNMPLNVLTGLSDQAITSKLTGPALTDFSNPLWSNYGYEISRQGEALLVGMFAENWNFDPKKSWNFLNEREYSLQGPIFSLKTHGFDMSEGEKQGLKTLIENRWKQIQTFFDTTPDPDPFTYHLYKDAELMGLQRRRMYQGYVDFKKKEVHAIYHSAVNEHHFEAHNSYLVQSLLGQALPAFLAEGLSHYFSPNWQKKGALAWAIRLKEANALLPETDLWDGEAYDRSSIYVRGSTVGGLVHYLAENYTEDLLRACRNPEKAKEIIKPHFHDFKSYLESFGASEESEKKSTPFFHLGMTFAHEGYNVYDGYASQAGKEALEKIKGLNGNSIAIVPYSGSRNTQKPVKYRFWEGAGGENSMSVVFARYHAFELGLVSLLKPQIYYGGAWPGAVNMQSKEDWELWHEYYKQWITHYALIAAMFDFEYFCVGVEFVHATLENPEKWASLVRDMRKIYKGPITYATNWGEEAEKIGFADELDFIGVNCYYPLSSKEEPTEDELQKGAEAINQKMKTLFERTQKNIVFTEVGFRSVARAWQNPHEEPKGRKADNEAQLRCYRTLLKALDSQEWFGGTYWWKWPSYLNYSLRNPRSFTPCGKEAELVLADWYKRWETVN